MTKHTPGQWIIQTPMTGDDLVIEACPGLEYHELARVRAPQYGKGPSFDEMHANARLIAASPELLEALSELLAARCASQEIVGHDPVTGHPLSREGMAALKAKAAIAKATGENV